MKHFARWTLKLMAPAVSACLALLIAGSTAQTPPTMPLVDLSIGPTAVNPQAVNIALALSVEFPTVGSAYRSSNYNHATTYLGYFDPRGCYNYKDLTAGAPLAGDYFYRTGTVDASGYCDFSGSTGRFSGNALNYVTTSSIDVLRYALTGGHRVVDTASTTILARAYLYNGWDLHNSTYFPAKRIPQAMVGKVIPPLIANSDVIGGGCKDKVWFGTSTASVTCDTAGATSSGSLNPTGAVGTVTLTTTNVVTVPRGDPAPAGGVFQTTTWTLKTTGQTTSTVQPTAGPITFDDVPIAVPNGTTTSAPPAPITTATAFITTTYTLVAGTSTFTPPAPPAPQGVIGTVNVPLSGTRYFTSIAPSLPYRTLQLTARPGNTNSVNVCRTGSDQDNPGDFKGPLDPSTNSPTDVAGGSCGGTGAYAGFPNRGRVRSGLPRNVYEKLQAVNTYGIYTAQNIYRAYTLQREYDLYDGFDNYVVSSTSVGTATATTTGVIYARVRVCDDSEKTTRSDLCERYPNGNYKPIGEIQRKATGVRLAAFGYLLDNTTSRYGGVLRAPMKYPGPTYTNTIGQPQTNTYAEWDASTGVFRDDPLGAAPTYTYSGVINYLNRFGTTGTLGAYKGFDPVGELYYEALRYFQGQDPSSQATAGSPTPAMADGFPYYTTAGTVPAKWEDPVQNACERRNYILTIGDVNTHYDKEIPGHRFTGSSLETSIDPTRAAASIPNSTRSFDAAAWTDILTGFETGQNPRSYQHFNGSAWSTQTTTGNPNPNSNNDNLATKSTGSGGRSAYYWAGAAYWANTQPIREDVKDLLSMKHVRVKTFTIDVDEAGNGDIEDTNPRGIKPRQSSFYLAGKYGWFNDANLDGNPFRTSGGANDNTEWQNPSATNTPDGYVLASQAQQLINGIRKFFGAASSKQGSATASAVSTSRFTANAPNGDFFAPLFNAGDWSGTVQRTRLVLNTSTQQIESTPGAVWDAGVILTMASSTTTSPLSDPYVKPVDRKIFTMSRDGSATAGQAFTVANKGNLDTEVRTALGTNPATGVADAFADQRINWLRGNQSDELSSTGGYLRQRGSVMGDVISSGPVYKEDADTNISGAGYLTFSQSVASRTATIYVGANDGMLHAFRARDGKELFAYIPRAVAPYLNKLTHPAYEHRPYVDAVPQVGEAQIGSSWKTLLVSGMGGGAQGVFALDVTAPESFGVDNVLWEFTDADDPQMGNVVTQPVLMKLKVPGESGSPATYKWFVVVGSGYNNYKSDGHVTTTGAQALFFLSVDKAANAAWQAGTNYFKVELPVANGAIANGLSNPGFLTGPGGEATLLYAGDLQGNIWKFDLTAGINNANLADSVFQASGLRKALFVATTPSGTAQPITTTPQVVEANASGYMVVFGTGKYVEPSDNSTADVQSIYGIWDSLENSVTTYTAPRSSLFQRTASLSGTSVVLSTATFAFGTNSSASPAQYRGWYINLPQTRERIAVEPALGIGIVAFSAAIPEGTCSGDGTGRRYCLNPVFGTNQGCDTNATPGIPSGPKIIQYELDATSYTARTPSGRRTVTIEQKVLNSSTKITDAGNALVSSSTVQSISIPAGRINWRELRQ